MEALRDLQSIYSLSSSRFFEYEGKDFVLPQIFKEQVTEINNNVITYNKYSAIIGSRGNKVGGLNIYMPNQWFYIASYFTDFYNELQKYKSFALKAISKERLKVLNGAQLTSEEYNKIKDLNLDTISQNYLIRFITDYTWWSGAKTIERPDFYVSPILNSARLVNASQSFVADLCAFLADKQELVGAIISGEDKETTNATSKNVVNENLQQIFYGAPGTGKSNTIKVKTEMAEKEGRVFRTTFHPDSDYSTFVGAYKPTMQNRLPVYTKGELINKLSEIKISGTTYPCHKFAAMYWESLKELNTNDIRNILLSCDFPESMYQEINKGIAVGEDLSQKADSKKIVYSFVPQTFTIAYLQAWQTSDPVYLIIEEINRGNCAQIFGDLFQLLDRKNGVSEYPIDADADLGSYIARELANSPREDFPDGVKEGKKLMLPSNLYIWATMNTSDQSLFPIDSAFKRRWDWTYIPINTRKEQWNIKVGGADYSWSSFLEKINDKINEMTSSEDKQLGFYFCKPIDNTISSEVFVNKVLFYLWNDVFKDYGFEDDIFKFKEGEKTETLEFRKFFKTDGDIDNSKVILFLNNLKVEQIGDAQGTSGSFDITFEGSPIVGDTAISKYIETIRKIVDKLGVDKVSGTLGADFVSDPEKESTRKFVEINNTGWKLATNIGIDAMKSNLNKLKNEHFIDIVF